MSLIVSLTNPRLRWSRFETHTIHCMGVRSTSFVGRRLEVRTFRLHMKSNSGREPVCLFLSLQPIIMRKSRIRLS
jgi:hypothetical protein